MDSLFSIWSPLFSTSWHSWDRLALAYDYLEEAGRLDDEVEELQHAERHGLQLPIPGMWSLRIKWLDTYTNPEAAWGVPKSWKNTKDYSNNNCPKRSAKIDKKI